MKHLYALFALPLLAACGQVEPRPICDWEALDWDKIGTPDVPVECLHSAGCRQMACVVRP